MAQQQKRMTLKEFVESHPELVSKYQKKKVSDAKMRYMCRCKRGHTFDYRERKKFPPNDKHYAPCQGMCPYCGNSVFTFIGKGNNVYPISLRPSS